jgi:hypothetical protein
MKGERIQYTQAKGGKVLWLPAAPQLTAAIRAMPAIGMTTFLVTEFGKPFSKDGIGNKMREWCDQAGLPHCSAHGLRKAAARRAADCQGYQSATQGRRRMVAGSGSFNLHCGGGSGGARERHHHPRFGVGIAAGHSTNGRRTCLTALSNRPISR